MSQQRGGTRRIDGQSSNLGRRFSSCPRSHGGAARNNRSFIVLRGWWTLVSIEKERSGRGPSPRHGEGTSRGEQKPRWTNGRKKMLEPICSPLFRLLLAPFRPPFVLSFFSQRQNLCYLLVTFIWSPRVLDLSRYSLLLSPPLASLFLGRPFSRSARYHLPTARSLEQPGTSYSGF